MHMLIHPEPDGERKSASTPPIPTTSTNKVGLWNNRKVTAKACFIRAVSGSMSHAVPHRSPCPEQNNFWANFLRRNLLRFLDRTSGDDQILSQYCDIWHVTASNFSSSLFSQKPIIMTYFSLRFPWQQRYLCPPQPRFSHLTCFFACSQAGPSSAE